LNPTPTPSERSTVFIPGNQIPTFRTHVATLRGVANNLLLKTWGGIGDQACAEPTLRFALKTFRNCDISLATELPELFTHLDFKRVFDLKVERPIAENYLTFETIVSPDNLTWEFFGHMITNCVDFPSMCAFRCQLPIADREVKLAMRANPIIGSLLPPKGRRVVVHPGRHWQIKTFPKTWWDEVLDHLHSAGVTPILIGADADDNRGTVDVARAGCLDLRNKLALAETVWLLNETDVLLTNDSSPMHLAVPGDAWIGFVATCKHPDFIMHWRKGRWAWRMENLGKGGIWDVMDYAPNKPNKIEVDKCDPELLLSWLPTPKEYAEWALSKLSS
jgi:hypothetical protein